MLCLAASKVGRNLKMGWDGAGDFHDRANRMARSKSTSGGGQFTGGVEGTEGAGSKARNPGKGEFMLAAATPAEDEGSKSGLISGAGLHGGAEKVAREAAGAQCRGLWFQTVHWEVLPSESCLTYQGGQKQQLMLVCWLGF